MKLYAMTTGRGEDPPLHAVAVHGPNPQPPQLGHRSVCGVYVDHNAGPWTFGDWKADSPCGPRRWCPRCVRFLREDGPPADPRAVHRAKKIHADAAAAGLPIPLAAAVSMAREQIAAEDAAHEAQPQLIGGPIPAGCAGESKATQAVTLDCRPAAAGLARHAALGPKVLAAVRRVMETTELSGNGRSLLVTLRLDAGFTRSEAEYDVETLIDAISRAAGEVLTAEDAP